MDNQPKRTKLTKGYIDRMRPGGKDEFHWDTEIKGFGLRVNPSGRTTFIVQGRVEGVEQALRLTIGPYGVFTLDQARNLAREHLRSMRMGKDPRELRRQDAALRVTLREVADAYFARPGMLKESTRAEMERHVEQMWGELEARTMTNLSTDERILLRRLLLQVQANLVKAE